MNEKYGLVLAGGGSKGSYQIGAWIAMRELKIDFEAVTGVSIGAINGALIAMDDLENALRFWESIEVKKGVNIETPLPDEENLFSPKNWSALFREVLKNGGFDASPTKEFISGFINEEKVRKGKARLGLVTVNITQKTPVYRFLEDIPDGKLIDFLLASADVPLAKNVGPDDDHYLDGGAYDNLPISFMRENGYNRLIVVDISTIKGIAHSMKIENSSVVYIRPHNPDDLGASFDFSADMNAKRMQLGYLDTMKAFSRYLGNIYCFDPKVFRKMVKNYGAKTVLQLEQLAYRFGMDNCKVYAEEEFLSTLKNLFEEEKKNRAEKQQPVEESESENQPEEEIKEEKKGKILDTISKLASTFIQEKEESEQEQAEDAAETLSEKEGDVKGGNVISAMLELIKTKRKSGEDVSLAEEFLEKHKE